jgi:hypothetical protein
MVITLAQRADIGQNGNIASVAFLDCFQGLNTFSRANRAKTIEANGVKAAIAILTICEITVSFHDRTSN